MDNMNTYPLAEVTIGDTRRLARLLLVYPSMHTYVGMPSSTRTEPRAAIAWVADGRLEEVLITQVRILTRAEARELYEKENA